MDKDAIIKQLRDVIDQLKHENESLKACIKELEAKLAMYENAHTPPSLKRGGKRKKDQNKGGRKKSLQPIRVVQKKAYSVTTRLLRRHC